MANETDVVLTLIDFTGGKEDVNQVNLQKKEKLDLCPVPQRKGIWWCYKGL